MRLHRFQNQGFGWTAIIREERVLTAYQSARSIWTDLSKRPHMLKLDSESNMQSSGSISRWLLVAGAMLALIATTGTRAQPRDSSSQQTQDHLLQLYNTNTGERLDIVYRRGDQYIPSALAKLDYFLRDHRTGDVRHFDPRLYDILSDLTLSVGHPGGEIDIVCGYRTSATNESLRAHSSGVAKNSLHTHAEAIDLRMPGIDTLKLRKAALALGRGGVGYYPRSDFIHVDIGRVRRWCFDCPANLISGN
jgi:uncharacterized protein YcbK (DUF882 family)